jgi:hypothetical protein
MAIRTFNSPSVEIRERDLSLRTPQNVGANIFVPGFTPQGPSDEVIMISGREELETIYGIPTNSAERYFYYTVRELLNSPATIYTFRLPYGAGTGDGFGTQHSALVYPVRSYVPSTSAVTTTLDLSAAVYVLGEPVHVNLTEDQYANALEGTLFDWSSTGANAAQLSSVTALGGAGVIVLDKAQTTINSQFEGYYVGIADNTNINNVSTSPNFDAITRANTLSLTSNFVGLSGGTSYTQIPNGTLQFNLSATFNGATNSVSQIMENLTDYNIDGREDDDLLSVGVFKIRKSIYATESFKLDFVVDDAIVGSIDSFRTELNPNGGASVPFFLEARDTNSRNVEILVNPNISNKFTQSSQDSSGLPRKKVRVLTQGLVNTNPTNFQASGITTAALTTIAGQIGYADALYPLGAYSPVTITQKTVGNIPTKINRALEAVKNDEIYDIDVVVEAGLGTIFTMASAAGTSYYDDTLYNSTLKAKVDTLRTSNDIAFTDGADLRANYSAVFNQFENFCNLPSNTGGRGDCIFVADPIRHILVTGKNTKILSDKTKSFQQHVYWAIRHQFELENTSYAATYGNWVQVYDEFTGEKMWQPFSGFAAAVMARSDAAEFPWSAPAGFNRGLLTTSALDLAVNPNQKQRDEFYKNNVNPVMFSPLNGMVIFGQKTLSRKPSAFDRINVRRLFLALERPTKKVSQFFVFEPNNEFTRTRFVNTLTPLFEFAKQNGGVYDYLIVADERVNTPEVIDNNELRASIYLKPVRTAEFIIVEFVASRTDASFEELI